MKIDEPKTPYREANMVKIFNKLILFPNLLYIWIYRVMKMNKIVWKKKKNMIN